MLPLYLKSPVGIYLITIVSEICYQENKYANRYKTLIRGADKDGKSKLS